ncbi:MAG: ABC transporter permease [Chloroflexota bacterium]
MDQVINTLYGIPLLGLVFQLIGYIVEVVPPIAPLIMRAGAPLALGALCGVMCERSGVVNIAIEGTMLASAFTGWVVGVALGPYFGETSSLPFGITPTLLIGLAAALLVALLISGVHAWLSITVKADQIISGTIINIAAFGVTGYINTILAPFSPTSGGSFRAFVPPKEVTDLPVVGWIIAMFLDQGPIAMSVIVLAVGFQILLFRSRWGLRTRAVGEHPRAVETAGVDVIRLRYRNVMVGGMLAGLAGAFLSMEATNQFQAGMSGGRGFIALAAMIVGRWTPIGAFGAAILFSTFAALGQVIGFNPPSGSLGEVVAALPKQTWDALPYLVTIIILAGIVGRSIPPAADGQPYEREQAGA